MKVEYNLAQFHASIKEIERRFRFDFKAMKLLYQANKILLQALNTWNVDRIWFFIVQN